MPVWGGMATWKLVPFRFPRLTPTVKKLLIVLAAAFVALAIVQNLVGLNLFGYLALDVGSASQRIGWAWQPLTYWIAFPPVPDALLSFGLQLLFLYFFLAPFEEAFGAKRTLQLSAVGVLAFALAGLALSLALSPFTGVVALTHPLYGSAGIALAAFGAFPVIAGNREILFMFVIPMKVWTAIVLGLGVSALLAVLARDPFILATYAAALGAGVGYAKWLVRPRKPPSRTKPRPRRRSGPDLKVVRGGADDDRPRYLN